MDVWNILLLIFLLCLIPFLGGLFLLAVLSILDLPKSEIIDEKD